MERLVLLPILFGASFVFAAGAVPNCWRAPGGFAEGNYSINVFTHLAGANAVEAVYAQVNRLYLTANSRPRSLSHGRWWIRTNATVPTNMVLSKPGLKRAAERQLRPVAQMNGVTISCVPILRPPR